jgi:hypothetical protein
MSGRTFTDEELDALAKSLRDFNEMPLKGGGADPLIDALHGVANEAADALAFLRAGGWRPISETPPRPMPVEIFRQNLRFTRYPTGEECPVDLVRDSRREIGFWDGQAFREMGTGHEYDEGWQDKSTLPTHWRALPPAPEESK